LSQSAINAGLFAAASKKEPWEQWKLVFKAKESLQPEYERLEVSLREAILDIVTKVNEKEEKMPGIVEGMKCFPFEIELKRTQANQGKGWNLGGILKKYF